MKTATRRPIALALFLTLFAAACATAPKETVTLVENMQQETTMLQSANEALVGTYYGALRQRVEDFITNVWIPSFLNKAVQNASVQTQMQGALGAANITSTDIIAKVNADPSLTAAERAAVVTAINNAAVGGRAQLGLVMIGFSQEALAQIAKQRSAMLDPIDQQEQLVLTNLRTAYAQLQAEQATVKAYLASVVNITQQQDAALQRAGLLDQRNAALNAAATASADAARLLSNAQGAEAFIAKLQQTNEKLTGTKGATNGTNNGQ
jgi:hypothetical protein